MTVKTVVVVMLPDVAEMDEVPAVRAVATPVVLIAATEVGAEAQITELVRF